MWSPPPIKIVLDPGREDTPSAAAFSITRPSLRLVPRIAEAGKVKPRGLLLVRSTPSTVPMPASSLTSCLRPVSVRTDSHRGQELVNIRHSALSEATPSAGTPYSVALVLSRAAPMAESVKSIMRKIRSACFFLDRCSPETVLDLAKMTLE